jgi:hypothetical protein
MSGFHGCEGKKLNKNMSSMVCATEIEFEVEGRGDISRGEKT